MRKLIPLLAALALSACAESPSFRHATYLGYAYQYDADTQLPILQGNEEPKTYDHFSNAFRGRNWR